MGGGGGRGAVWAGAARWEGCGVRGAGGGGWVGAASVGCGRGQGGALKTAFKHVRGNVNVTWGWGVCMGVGGEGRGRAGRGGRGRGGERVDAGSWARIGALESFLIF